MKNFKISIIIPNYNGYQNLKSNLPSVLKLAKNRLVSEVIIVDDGSTDNSIELIKELFINELTSSRVKLIRNKKNLGFGPTVNRGVKKAQGEIIILFNTDVVPQKDILKHALLYFQKKDTFAVSFLEKTKVNGKIELHGRGRGEFKKGFFLHQKYSDYQHSGYSLWPVGGAAAFDRKKWLKLGGFDEVFAPFYWEDVDLGFRAWLAGYKVYFEPKAVVWHYHQKGSIKTHYSADLIKTISYRNQFLFFWKHFLWGKYLVWHLFWLPYHFFNTVFKGDWSFFKGFFGALKNLKKLKREKAKITRIEVRDIFKPK